MPRIFSDGLRLPGIGNNPPEDPKAGVYDRDHASTLPSSGGLYSLSPFRPHTPHAQSERRSDERGEARTAEVEPPEGS